MQTLTPEFQKAHNISNVIDRFDTGGQKIVYIVQQNDGQKLAMKLFRLCSKRDIQEIELLQRLNEVPGISKVVKVVEFEGSPVLFEEFIDAPDLEDILTEYAGDAKKISALLTRSIEILKPIWTQRIVHRDLKPKNIKILANGDPVILDFGIARDLSAESITETGDIQPMTWNYATPEQYLKAKEAISYRTDFFSLGVIGYQLYYQRHPFGSSRSEVEQKFLSKDNAISVDVDCSLNPFFEATLAIEPSGRPRSPDALMSVLK